MYKSIVNLVMIIFLMLMYQIPIEAQSVFKLASHDYPQNIQKIESWSYYNVPLQNGKPHIDKTTPIYTEYNFKKGKISNIVGYMDNEIMTESIVFKWNGDKINEITKYNYRYGKKNEVNTYKYNIEKDLITERVFEPFGVRAGKNIIRISVDDEGNRVENIEFYHRNKEKPYKIQNRVLKNKLTLLSETNASPTNTFSTFKLLEKSGDTLEIGEYKVFTNNEVSSIYSINAKSKVDPYNQILSIETTRKSIKGKNKSSTDIHWYKNHYNTGEVYSSNGNDKLTLSNISYCNIRDNIKIDFNENGQCSISPYNPEKKESPFAVALAGDWTFDLLNQKQCTFHDNTLTCEDFTANAIMTSSNELILRRKGLEDIVLEIIK